MKEQRAILLILIVLGLAGCEPPAALDPTETPPQAPTMVPTVVSTDTPTTTPAQELLPDLFSLGDTTTRSIDGMVMVYVPSGEFEMGWPGGGDTAVMPIHTVALDGFWMDQTEVTNAQYELCVAAGQCEPSLYADIEWLNGDNQPVMAITWYDADTYCKWAGGQLPTEAQLEYAARGPEGRKFPWGEDLADCTMANFMDCVGTTADVGSYPAGASWCGALDLSGNVYEWAANWYYQYSAEKKYNPTGPTETDDLAERKMMRGGAWTDRPQLLLSAQRIRFEVDLKSDTVGFRCVVPAAAMAASDVTHGTQ